jgi:hypothetical protein
MLRHMNRMPFLAFTEAVKLLGWRDIDAEC